MTKPLPYRWLPSAHLEIEKMSHEVHSCYRLLWDYCWKDEGIPKDMAELAIICRYPAADFKKNIWSRLEQFFYDGGEKYQNKILDFQRKKAEKLSKFQSLRRGGKRNKRKYSSDDYFAIHQWLRKNYGNANKCESPTCEMSSTVFQWSKKHGFEHERKRENYWMLCASCHSRYDLTKEMIKRKRETRAKKKVVSSWETTVGNPPVIPWKSMSHPVVISEAEELANNKPPEIPAISPGKPTVIEDKLIDAIMQPTSFRRITEAEPADKVKIETKVPKDYIYELPENFPGIPVISETKKIIHEQIPAPIKEMEITNRKTDKSQNVPRVNFDQEAAWKWICFAYKGEGKNEAARELFEREINTEFLWKKFRRAVINYVQREKNYEHFMDWFPTWREWEDPEPVKK